MGIIMVYKPTYKWGDGGAHPVVSMGFNGITDVNCLGFHISSRKAQA